MGMDGRWFWLLALLLAPLVLILPGAVALGSLPRSQDDQARARGLIEALWRMVVVSVVLTGGVALVLADLGVYRLRLLVPLAVMGSGLVWLLAGRPRLPLPRPARSDILPLALFVFALTLFSPPHETILGAAAPGSYVSAGAQIALHGSLPLREPLLAEMAPADRALFLWNAPETPGAPLRFPDFYMVDTDQGVSVPQFFPLHPVWLAIGFGLGGGVWGSLWLLPFWGALGILGVYYAGRWAMGETAAAIGALALTLTAPQVWFSRYTMSEVLTQALLWAAIYAFSLYVTRGYPPRHGLLAGLALGGVMLTRIDTPFVLALPVGLAVWLVARGLVLRQRGEGEGYWRTTLVGTASFFAPLVGLVALAAIHTALFARPYVQATSIVLPFVARLLGLGLVGVGIAVALGWLLWRKGISPAWRVPGLATAWWRPALAVGIVALAGWAYFVRPLFGEALTWTNWYSGTVTAYPHLSLVQIGWYLSPLGVALAVGGAAWLAYRGPLHRAWLVLGLGLFFAALYLANPLNSPRHIYVMRRYLPAVLPAFSLFAGYALAVIAGVAPGASLVAASRSPWARVGRPAVAMALGLLLLLGMLPQTTAVRANREGAGSVDQIAGLAAQVDPTAVVLFTSPNPMGVSAQVGMPLQFLHGRDVLMLIGEPNPARLGQLIRGWQAAGRPVMVVADASADDFDAAGVSLTPVTSVSLSFPVLEAPVDRPPQRWDVYRPVLQLYRVAEPGAGLTTDVGGLDGSRVVSGWYGREQHRDGTFRWTNGDAVARIAAPPGATQLHLRLGGRPGQVTPLDVTVDGRAVGRLDVQPDLAEYTLPLPADLALAATAEVRLVSPTFAPGGADPRQLGVLVDWLGFE